MRLWRATAERDPWFGSGSFWAPERGHAERYVTTPGFGGPTLYTVDVGGGDDEILDLRHDPWRVLEALGLAEREDYGAGELDHELFWALASVFKAHGYRWVVFREGGFPGDEARGAEEWMYLGDELLPAAPADNLRTADGKES